MARPGYELRAGAPERSPSESLLFRGLRNELRARLIVRRSIARGPTAARRDRLTPRAAARLDSLAPNSDFRREGQRGKNRELAFLFSGNLFL